MTWRFHVLACLWAYLLIIAFQTWRNEELKLLRYSNGFYQSFIIQQFNALQIADENQQAAYFALKKMKRERRKHK